MPLTKPRRLFRRPRDDDDPRMLWNLRVCFDIWASELLAEYGLDLRGRGLRHPEVQEAIRQATNVC